MAQSRLHTDALSEKYGPIHAVVLKHDLDQRIRDVELVDKRDIMRTYALTFLNYDPGNTEIVAIDGEIRSGGLIGETFRKHGYTINRQLVSEATIAIPQWMQRDFNVVSSIANAALINFFIEKPGVQPLQYGTIFEIYSPDFIPPRKNISDTALSPDDSAAQSSFEKAIAYLNERAA